ncbi:MAG: WbqC family protein [Christensenellales bacterium]|jgi:hypothetical protein
MKTGVMQPYFFPYLGYWQLMNSVDTYVVYDDVNYIKGGRINRNAILLNGKAHNINLILRGASPNLLINEVKVSAEPQWRAKLLRTISQAYSKAPFVEQVMPVLDSVINNQEENLAKFLFYSFEKVSAYLGIETKLIMSSDIPKDNELKGRYRLYDIFKALDTTEYYNAINGMSLYAEHSDEFSERGVALRFLEMLPVEYPQLRNEFVPNLSIIDIMMFNSKEQCSELLNQYKLL